MYVGIGDDRGRREAMLIGAALKLHAGFRPVVQESLQPNIGQRLLDELLEDAEGHGGTWAPGHGSIDHMPGR